jgi:hypothetical protein
MENSIYYDVQRLSKLWFVVSICFIDAVLFYAVSGMLTGEIGFVLSLVVTVVLFSLALLDIYLFLILKLTIKIDFEFLYITMLPFFDFKIPVEEISFLETAGYRRFIDYGGIGFGNVSKQNEPAYFLKGKIGVRLYGPDQSRIIVGAADPKKFINAIQYAQQRKRILSGMN